MNKILRHALSGAIAGVMLFNNIPPQFFNFSFSYLKSITSKAAEGNTALPDFVNPEDGEEGHVDFSGGTNNTIDINNEKQFNTLYNAPAVWYCNKDIYINFATSNALYWEVKFEPNAQHTVAGLGDEDHPYKGNFSNAGGTAAVYAMDTPLFSYLSDKAILPSNKIYFRRNSDGKNTALLADKVVHDTDTTSANTWAIVLNQGKDDNDIETNYSFSGFINEIDLNCYVDLDIINNTSADVISESDAGMFCNTLGTGSNLKITYSGFENFNVTADNGSAGSLVGYMDERSKVTLKSNFNYSGTVTSISTGDVGGMVGHMEQGAAITTENGFSFSGSALAEGTGSNSGGIVGYTQQGGFTFDTPPVISADMKSTLNAGGLAGYAKYDSTSDQTFDVSTLINCSSVSPELYPKLYGTKNAGGLFGCLECTGTGKITIKSNSKNAANENIKSTSNQNVESYGGLIGTYTAEDLTAELELKDIAVKANRASGSVYNYGGLIGTLGDDTTVYTSVSNVDTNCVNASALRYGGLVGLVGSAVDEKNEKDVLESAITGNGSFINITGAVKSSGNYSISANADGRGAGGLVGLFRSGVLRLNADVDLGSTAPSSINSRTGVLVGNRTDTLIYRTSSECTLTRPASQNMNDVGNWGEVLTLDKIETDYLTYDSDDHTVEVKDASYDTDKNVTISGLSDFAKLALNIQLNTNDGIEKGALCFDGSTKSETLLTKTINIEISGENKVIDLAGTGLTGLTRDNSDNASFTNTLNGNGSTILLAVGEPSGYIYTHTHSGLFAKTGNATINGLTIGGTMNINHSGDSNLINYAGSLAAEHKSDNLALNNVTVNDTIIAKSGSYAGGVIGLVSGGTVYAGSTGKPCTISATIKNTATATDGNTTANVGGFISKTTAGTVNINNLLEDGLNIEVKVGDKATVGGLLGYEWAATDVSITNLVIGATGDAHKAQLKVTGTNTNFGGLVYKAYGYWCVNDDSLSFANAKIEASNNPAQFGILISEGVPGADKGIYLEVCDEDYYDMTGLALSVGTPMTYDEFVAKTKRNLDNNQGIISLPTSGRINVSGSTVYQNRMSVNKYNSNSRYYYNLDTLRKLSEETPSDLSGGQKVLLWSLRYYCATNLQSYFTDHIDNKTITGTVNLEGLSYYPINVPYNGLTISGATITFDNQQITLYDSDGTTVRVSDATATYNNQHHLMQCGLLKNIKSDASVTKTLTLSGTNTFKGAIGKSVDTNSTVLCGALLCGYTEGVLNGFTPVNASVVCDQLTTINLEGVYVRDYDGSSYAPLLINRVNSYSNISIIGVRTVGSSGNIYSMNGNTYAASSLIGNVGDKNAKNISLAFSNIKLDSRRAATVTPDMTSRYSTQGAIFSRATLLESFRYAESSSGTYNFTVTEDWGGSSAEHKVTYGYEIDNSVENANQQQHYFKDSTGRPYVSPVSKPVGEGTAYGQFTYANYLPYVYASEATITNLTSYGFEQNVTYHELKVNLYISEITIGCGTYGDPYIITDGAQLEKIAKILDSPGECEGYSINYPNGGGNTCNNTSADSQTHKRYKCSGTTFSKLNVAGNVVNGGSTVNRSTVISYIRDAYYRIDEDITLSSSYIGLGPQKTDSMFRGVIVGKDIRAEGASNAVYPTITNESQNPLIKLSGGSVVKNLNIVYNNSDNTAITLTQNSIEKFKPVSGDTTGGCKYFGGVMGQILGGDNIIDNVNVTFNRSITVTGKCSHLIPVGGYVGVVKNGGLIFRGMSGKDFLTATTISQVSNNDFLYVNPYVGRVLDGFAITDDISCKSGTNGASTLNNGTKNYSISFLNKNCSGDNKLYLNAGNTNMGATKRGSKKWSTIMVPDAQALFVLSAIVSSGAASYVKSADRYVKGGDGGNYETAYALGRTRIANYSYVGNRSADTGDSDFNNAVSDGTSNDSPKIPYMIFYYTQEQIYPSGYVGSNSAKKYPCRLIAATETRFSIKLDSQTANYVYDMEGYGSGFRGINAMFNETSYHDNPDRQVINMFGFDGNNKTINLAMDVRSYGENDYYKPYGVGLFPRFQQNTSGELPTTFIETLNGNGILTDNADKKKYTVTGLTLSGSVRYSQPSGSGTNDYCVGGFAGRNYESKDKTVYYYFDDIKLNGLSVSGGKVSGGLIGRVADYNISNAVIQSFICNNVSSTGVTVLESDIAGGIIGEINKCSQNVLINGKTVDGKASTTEADKFKVTSITGGTYNGGLIGYTNKIIDINHITLLGTDAETSEIGSTSNDYAGGFIGRTEASSATVNKKTKHYGKVNIADSSVSGITINSKKYSGGMIGYADGDEDSDDNGAADGRCLDVSESAVSNCHINVYSAGEGNGGGIAGYVDKAAYISDASVTECSFNINASNDAVSHIGGLIGCVFSQNVSSQTGVLSGYDLLVNNNSFTYEGAVSEANQINGDWVGRCDYSPIKLVGISKQGTGIVGKDYGSNANNSHADNCFIYADYNGTAESNSEKKPYVTINPQYMVGGKTEGEQTHVGGLKFTGDGVTHNSGVPIVDTIITESKNSEVKKRYRSSIVDLFTAKENENSKSYRDLLMKYSEADDNNKTGFPDPNMPVVLINDANEESITAMINTYISVLTNCDQTGTGTTAQRYGNIAVTSYKYNSVSEVFDTVARSSMIYRDNKLYNAPGRYDNQSGQFTMLDVQYFDPTGKTTDVVFHLHIPVFVKKVLNFKFKATVVPGTVYCADDYLNKNKQVISANASPVTAYITFTYDRTAQEWADEINAGENLRVNFQKKICLNYQDESSRPPTNTKFILVDKNSHTPAFYEHTVTPNEFPGSDANKTAENMIFDDFFSGFNSNAVTINDLLLKQGAITAATDSGGTLVNLLEGEDQSTATIEAVYNGQNIFLRPLDEENDIDSEGALLDTERNRYKVNIAGNPIVQDAYYLTVQTPQQDYFESSQEIPIIKNMIQYNSNTLEMVNINSNTNSKSIPTYNNSDKDTNYAGGTYIFCDFFKQDLSIDTHNEASNTAMSAENNTITITLNSNITVLGDDGQRRDFSGYSSDLELFHEFSISLLKSVKVPNTDPAKYINEYSAIAGGAQIKTIQYTISGTDYKTDIATIKITKPTDKCYISLDDSIKSKITNLSEDFTISAVLELEYDPSVLSDQFPLSSDGSEGIIVNAGSNIAYTSDQLHNSPMHDSETAGNPKFYITKKETPELKYNLPNVIGNADGNTSQLGINPCEVSADSVMISAAGVLNATNISDVSSYDKVMYTLKLERKNSGSNIDNYSSVNIGDYMSEINFTDISGNDLVVRYYNGDGIEQAVLNSETSYVTCLVPWSATEKQNKQMIINTSYKVYTGNNSKFEQAKHNENSYKMYSNYKVILSAEIKSSTVASSLNCTPDYIVYTNACVNSKLYEWQ